MSENDKVPFVVYFSDTGRLFMVGQAERRMIALQTRAGRVGLETEALCHPDTHYVVEGAVVERPVLPATVSKTTIVADDEDAAVIDDLPIPCAVKVDGETHVIDTGMLEIASPMPAVYTVEIDHFPYQHFKVEIVANAPVS